MDKTQKIVVTLLVLSIVFSVFAVVINFGLFGVDLSDVSGNTATGQASGSSGDLNGEIKFFVEDNSVDGG